MNFNDLNKISWECVSIKFAWVIIGMLNADLKIPFYVRAHMKIIPGKFRIFNRKNFRAIYP